MDPVFFYSSSPDHRTTGTPGIPWSLRGIKWTRFRRPRSTIGRDHGGTVAPLRGAGAVGQEDSQRRGSYASILQRRTGEV